MSAQLSFIDAMGMDVDMLSFWGRESKSNFISSFFEFPLNDAIALVMEAPTESKKVFIA